MRFRASSCLVPSKRAVGLALVIGILPVLVFGTLTFGRMNSSVAPIAEAKDQNSSLKHAVPTLGSQDAPVRLRIFADYQCRLCQLQMLVIEDLLAEQADRVAVEVVLLPHDEELSMRPAVAAYASFMLGVFPEFHRELHLAAMPFDEAGLDERARRIGLDPEDLRAQMASPEISEAIAAFSAEADGMGVDSTPQMFLNDVRLSGFQYLDDLSALISAQEPSNWPHD